MRSERLRFLGLEKITDRLIARERYAIPPLNPMETLNEYKIIKGTGVFTGETLPNFGQPGGATQVFITGEKSLLPQVRLPTTENLQSHQCDTKRLDDS